MSSSRSGQTYGSRRAGGIDINIRLYDGSGGSTGNCAPYSEHWKIYLRLRLREKHSQNQSHLLYHMEYSIPPESCTAADVTAQTESPVVAVCITTPTPEPCASPPFADRL